MIVLSILGGLLIGIAAIAVTRPRFEVSSRVRGFVTAEGHNVSRAERSLVDLALGSGGQRDRLTKLPQWQSLALELDVAGIDLGIPQIAAITLVGSVLLAGIMYRATSSPLGLLFGLLGPFLANLLIHNLANRQRKNFDEQLPDNLQVIASAMRAGQTFIGGLTAVTEDAPEPSRRELRRAVTDAQLGVPIEEALDGVGGRMKSGDFKHVGVIAMLQRESGGNTAEVVDLVAGTIRERLELRRMVRALTAQGRLAAVLLAGLPVGLLMIVSAINPAYMHPMFHTTVGLICLGVAGGLTLLGALAINKVVKIEL
jgi:tight adherence protein B